MIHIIGADASDPDFARQILLHVGHHLYEMDRSKEKLAIDRVIVKEIERNIKSSNETIQKIANGFKSSSIGSGLHSHRNTNPSFMGRSPGSAFFARCFRAYVTEDHAFLSAVKSNFGESYQSFAEIIARLPNK